MSDEQNKWSQPTAPPPPLFLGEKERDLVKQVNDELIERVIGQVIAYYPIDLERTNFHPLYNEAVVKTFLSPVRVHALIDFKDRIKITLVPNITNICYGRGVGYKIEEVILPENIQKISATEIRKKMRDEGKLK